MTDQSYDLVVIGAGPGGYVAAIRAAQLGMRVACVDKDSALGGTCLNVGCIPSKALLDSSERYDQAKAGLSAHGVMIKDVTLDLGAMMARKNKVVHTLTRGIAGLFRKHKITWLKGTARLISSQAIEINGDDRQTVETERILIATGSAPIALPSAPFDGTRILSSTEALALSQVPRRLAVVGGGAIGLELGSVWSRLGAEVVVIEMLDRLVPGMDSEMAVALQRALKKQGLKFRLSAKVEHVEKTSDRLQLTIDSRSERSTESCDALLVAIGRRPYTEGLGVDSIGIALDERGFIRVDERFQTNVPGVYAIGDVTPGLMLAHKAEEEGIAAVELMRGLPGHVNYDAIPNVVYTWPELAGVGLTEEEAERQGRKVRTGSFPFSANGRARCMNETEGSIKVIADARTDQVLGVHIFGAHASELIAEAALAMEFFSSAEDIARSVHAHPTLAEALKEAALAVDQRAVHI